MSTPSVSAATSKATPVSLWDCLEDKLFTYLFAVLGVTNEVDIGLTLESFTIEAGQKNTKARALALTANNNDPKLDQPEMVTQRSS